MSSEDSDQGFQSPDEVHAIDLAHLRDLLSLLKDMDVAAFSAGGVNVAFRVPEPGEVRVPLAGRKLAQVLQDEDASTSSRPVSGFNSLEARDGFKNPNLWPGQGGRVLRFDGSFEP